MTLFQISCDTCQTKLNVRQKSAIDQILACPKCGSMVQVVPPHDWDTGEDEKESTPRGKKSRPFVKPNPDPALPETESNINHSVSENLKEVVKKPKSAKPTGTRPIHEKRWQGDHSPAEKQRPSDAANEPLLPGDHWSSPRSRQRKKLLLAFGSAAAILLIGIGAVIYAVNQLADNPDRTGQNTGQQDNRPKNVDETAGKTTTDQKAPDNINSQPSKAEQEKPLPKGNPSTTGDVDPDSEIDQQNPPNGNQPEKSITTDDPPNKLNTPVETVGKEAKADPDALPGLTQGTEDNVARLEGFFGELDSFSTLFEQNNSFLTARGGFTENDLAGSYGQTRFFIERSLKKTPDRKRALQIPILKLDFEKITLLQFLDFHFQMTSYPVAVDVTPIQLSGVSLHKEFSLSLTETTFEDALNQVAKQLDLAVIQGNHSLVVTIPNRDTLLESEYQVSDIAPTPEGRQKIIEEIQTYINKESWSQVGGEGIITANDQKGTIVVKHFGWAQVRIKELLRNIRCRRALPLEKPNPNFRDNDTRLNLAKELRSKEISIFQSDPISISQLAALLSEKYDIHLFVNWEATAEDLLPSGKLPLAVDRESAGQILKELAETMKLEPVWHSDKVVELTTPNGAASNLTFESYDVMPAVTARFTAEDLKRALKKLLQSNRLADFDRAVLDVDLQTQNALYAVLPQSAHRNVEGILTAIANSDE